MTAKVLGCIPHGPSTCWDVAVHWQPPIWTQRAHTPSVSHIFHFRPQGHNCPHWELAVSPQYPAEKHWALQTSQKGRILPESVLEFISAVICPVLWQSSWAGKATLPNTFGPSVFSHWRQQDGHRACAPTGSRRLCAGARGLNGLPFVAAPKLMSFSPLPLANAAVVIWPGGGGVAMAESRCIAARSTHRPGDCRKPRQQLPRSAWRGCDL